MFDEDVQRCRDRHLYEYGEDLTFALTPERARTQIAFLGRLSGFLGLQILSRVLEPQMLQSYQASGNLVKRPISSGNVISPAKDQSDQYEGIGNEPSVGQNVPTERRYVDAPPTICSPRCA